MASSASKKPECITGGCECRSIRYKISFPEGSEWPPSANHCHCSQCRKTVGGLFATFLTIPVANLFHESSAAFKLYHSSEHGRRGFCTNCGGGIYFFESNDPSDVYHVTASSIDTEFLTKDLLAGLEHDLYSGMAIEGIDDQVSKHLKRHVADSKSEAPTAPSLASKIFGGRMPLTGDA